MREDNKYLLGCSGFFYRDWKGKFYPEDIKPSDWLSYYCRYFNTVEINSTFYKFPTKENLKRFYRNTPQGFVFSVKVNRIITHLRKFTETEELLKNFYETVATCLGDKLGAFLFQFPPSYRYSEENLNRLIKQINTDFTNVFEFRNPNWWREEVYKTLAETNVTFCSVSAPGLPEDIVKTSEVLYIRMHGKNKWYRYYYTEEELYQLASRLKKLGALRIYVYFNNDYDAAAPYNCLKLKEILTSVKI